VRRVAIALVHYPVLDAQGATVTSAVTNLDVHDLSRSAKSYGMSDYFIVTPIEAQRELVGKICQHWAEGSSGRRIPARREALALVRVVASLEEAFSAMGGREAIEVWTTGARADGAGLAMGEARARLEGEGKAVLIVFGTAWGLAAEVHAGADARLLPIVGARATGYNHLSVRSACAIYADRLLGER
jgi:hypothetical protein